MSRSGEQLQLFVEFLQVLQKHEIVAGAGGYADVSERSPKIIQTKGRPHMPFYPAPVAPVPETPIQRKPTPEEDRHALARILDIPVEMLPEPSRG